MSKFKGFALGIIIVEIMIVLLVNGVYYNQNTDIDGRLHIVETRRLIKEIEKQKPESFHIEAINLDKYETLVNISSFDVDERCNNDYLVEEINGKLYRIEYTYKRNVQMPFYINLLLIGMIVVTTVVFMYVYNKVLKPFWNMRNLSFELAKGNLSMPIKEEKSRLFGRFLWGMDMLREKLEDNKEKEMEFQKERKTLILSLSHDIKTPLSSIELYSKALSENLYETQEKKDEALQGIARNVKEIKGYVNEIVTASREDFLNLEVSKGEFYLSEVMKPIESYYRDKLSAIHTEFTINDFADCLVIGDKNRMVEVIQNIMENTIKYGDGMSVHISFSEEEDCKLVHIANSGCNLKKEELPNIFDSFYRGSNSTNKKGNGLGLYICKTLMRKMEGDIFARIEKESFVVTVVIKMA